MMRGLFLIGCASLIAAQLVVLSLVPQRGPVSACEHYETSGFASVELRGALS